MPPIALWTPSRWRRQAGLGRVEDPHHVGQRFGELAEHVFMRMQCPRSAVIGVLCTAQPQQRLDRRQYLFRLGRLDQVAVGAAAQGLYALARLRQPWRGQQHQRVRGLWIGLEQPADFQPADIGQAC
ncbi:hypothetical protein AU476_28190 [Cupriavidus sp. UYMSc13B]|nr:hypothetical protein AU476_28190 [Cupriavidus sp. UYMSc13B]